MMKSFISKFILFLIPIAIIVLVLENIVSKNPKQAKSDYIYHHLEHTETMILGASTIACALNPEYMAPNSASMAIAGNTIEVDHRMYEKFVDKLPNLKLIIYDLSNGYLDYKDPKFDESASLLLHYNLIGNPKDKKIRDLLVTTANFKYTINKTRDILLKGDKEDFNQYGFLTSLNETNYSFKNLNYNPEKIKNSAAVNEIFKLHTFTNDKIYEDNFKLLRKMIRDCRDRNIKVVLLSTPKYSYYQQVQNDYAQRRANFLKLMVDNKNVFFIDDELWNNNCTECFYDILHLNPMGAKNYSKYISKKLNEKNILR